MSKRETPPQGGLLKSAPFGVVRFDRSLLMSGKPCLLRAQVRLLHTTLPNAGEHFRRDGGWVSRHPFWECKQRLALKAGSVASNPGFTGRRTRFGRTGRTTGPECKKPFESVPARRYTTTIKRAATRHEKREPTQRTSHNANVHGCIPFIGSPNSRHWKSITYPYSCQSFSAFRIRFVRRDTDTEYFPRLDALYSVRCVCRNSQIVEGQQMPRHSVDFDSIESAHHDHDLP